MPEVPRVPQLLGTYARVVRYARGVKGQKGLLRVSLYKDSEQGWTCSTCNETPIDLV